MTHEQVNAALKEYRATIGHCGHLEAEIRRLRRAIRSVREGFARDLADPPVSRLDGAPRATTPSNPTERIALTLAEGSAFARSDAGAQVKRIEAQIAALASELESGRLQVQYVDSWLSGLPERERWVIERHVIEGEIWHDVIASFNARFGDDISRDRLKRLQQRALERIYAIAA